MYLIYYTHIVFYIYIYIKEKKKKRKYCRENALYITYILKNFNLYQQQKHILTTLSRNLETNT